MTRPDLLRDAVVEAARQFMAAQLRWENYRGGVTQDDVSEALQTLRDALSRHSKVRKR